MFHSGGTEGHLMALQEHVAETEEYDFVLGALEQLHDTLTIQPPSLGRLQDALEDLKSMQSYLQGSLPVHTAAVEQPEGTIELEPVFQQVVEVAQVCTWNGFCVHDVIVAASMVQAHLALLYLQCIFAGQHVFKSAISEAVPMLHHLLKDNTCSVSMPHCLSKDCACSALQQGCHARVKP